MNRDTATVSIDADTSGLDAALKAASESTRNFGKVFTSTIKTAVISGKSFEDTLRSMAARISEMALNSAFAPIENSISNLFNSMLSGAIAPQPFAKGGVFADGRTIPFARGGVVSSPTQFALRDGNGLMGEAGPEAIMPLARGPNGRLGVSGANASPVNVVFNVNAQDAESFRHSEGQITAMLARTVQRGQRKL